MGESPSLGEMFTPPPRVVSAPGAVEKAIRKDLRRLGAKNKLGKATLIEIALVLARAIDARGDAGPTTTAKLAQELRAVWQVVMRTDGDSDSGADFEAGLGKPG